MDRVPLSLRALKGNEYADALEALALRKEAQGRFVVIDNTHFRVFLKERVKKEEVEDEGSKVSEDEDSVT